MKKIIMLITMFVLSVGFLAAQVYFPYQAVVVDADGNLVVDQTVTPSVTITDGNGANVQQTLEPVQTSLNGHALLLIEAPETIDWKTANITVQFAAADVTIPANGPDRVPGTPYALQALDDELTTDMIVDYYGRATTTMDDMEAIFEALENNPSDLAADWKAALIDTIINNRDVAKEIVLHYLNTGTADDVQAMFEALSENENGAKEAIIEDLKDLIGESPSDVREVLYDILSYYTTHMTPTDVNNVYAALPNDVKLKLASLCVEYLKNHKGSVIMHIVMEYMEKINVSEFNQLVQALENNDDVFPIMLAQFNTWLDEYFQSRYSGGNHVQEVVESTIEDNYYAQCTPAIDLCQLKNDLEAMSTCFEALDELSFYKDNSLNYVAVLPYRGSNPTSVGVTLDVNSLILGSTTIYPTATVDPSAKTITVVVSPNDLPLVTGDTFEPTFTINVECSDDPITIAGDTYTEQ